MKQKYCVVNFSGGKDSTAMLLRMIELGEHIDEVVCCDTYKEFPAMYRHIEKVKKVVEDVGIKFTHLRNEKTFDYFMFSHERTRGKHKDKVGYGWATPRNRWCTSTLKQWIIQRHLKEIAKNHSVVNCVGIASDEQYRIDRPANKRDGIRMPLVEWGWDEATALQYCYSKGFDWEGLYELFDRVSCWCCPLKSLEELRTLRKHFPDLWSELKDMDCRSWNHFRPDFSVEDLDVRFQFEEERLAQGLSITNKDFHSQLKTILMENKQK